MEAERKKIIIVDDSAIYRAGLRELINRHEQLTVVAEAECGDTAIEAIQKVPAVLVFLDLSLPRYSGFQILIKNQGDLCHKCFGSHHLRIPGNGSKG
jgi:DNA-binding NarL/FixJ family response regulator